ncbi:MAG: hydrogenase maturation nickel metallochaperone HypA [Verrucomicrobiota bacterium]|nr:zinc ribbon domain-containing protein [Chthoniobacterales bacterium]MDQ3413974.1 hydrogenase maturation nickel metallochaperone HypA [Verrucomicrobiota bacterium]
MADVTARQRFECPSCGGAAEWSPAKQALVCPFCGAVSPMQPSTAAIGAVQEHDLATALSAVPDSARGWETATRSVKCQSCQAISVFTPERVAQNCDFCGSPALVPYEQTKAPIRPESVLPFKVDQGKVRDQVHAWYRSRWFAPNRFKNRAFTDTIHGLYLPYWTFDAQVAAQWTAEAGYYYYTTETYRDSKGNTQTRQVQHVRWQYASGALDHFFDDELVPASRGVPADLLRGIEPFPTKDLAPYDAGYVSGWVVEQYQIDLVAAAQRSREAMDTELRRLCAAQIPGDTHRNLQVDADYSAQTFKHVLLPVWLLNYQYSGATYRIVANGVTGALAGKYPKSWIKIALLVILLLIIGLIIFYFAG